MPLNIPEPTGGSPLEVMLARIIRQQKSQRITESGDIGVKEGPTATQLYVKDPRKGGAGSTVAIARFSIVSVMDTMLTGNKYNADGVLESDITFIAKPCMLRINALTSRGTKSYTYISAMERTVAHTGAGSATSKERLEPSYEVGDEIWAANIEKTGISQAHWIDLNADGRTWLTVMVATDICVNNVLRQALIARSTAYNRP